MRAESGIATGGFARPLAEPDMHLSLCIRLSRNQSEVGRIHPAATIALNLEPAHLILLTSLGLPHAPVSADMAGTPVTQQRRYAGFGILLPQPSPEPVSYVPVETGQDVLGSGAVTVEVRPTAEDGIQLPK